MKTIRELREEQGLSQFALAVRAGVSPAAIYAWESGKKVPGSMRLRRIADCLGVSMGEITLISTSHNGKTQKTVTDKSQD